MAQTDMRFTAQTIAPAGRNKYGHYLAAGNITKSVINTTYGGNNTTTTIGDTGTTGGGQKDTAFYCMFSQPTLTFDSVDLLTMATATTEVVAYRNFNRAPTLVCDMSSVVATYGDDGIVQSLEVPINSGMTNIPNGITITIGDNGTSATTITLYGTSPLLSDTAYTGTIGIPVLVYKRDEAVPVGDDVYDWWDSQDDCEQVWLELAWNVNKAASSTYVLDLSNQSANINCDENGNMFSASIMTVTCTASTTMNGAPVSSVTYSLAPLAFNGRGVSINPTTGVFTFNYSGSNPYFAFDSNSLGIDVIADLGSGNRLTKTMTIYKNFPGADGSPATSHWINTSANQVKYNPNTGVFTPPSVSAVTWKQVGYEEPVIDSTTQMYAWWSSAPTPFPYTAKTLIPMHEGETSLTFGIKNSNDEFYETEDIPILSDGLSGGTGPQGPQGPSGATGEDGVSSWYLSLDNNNCSINCDEDGTAVGVLPYCKGKLYYGTTQWPVSALNFTVQGEGDYWNVDDIIDWSVTNHIITLSVIRTGFTAFSGDTLNVHIVASASGGIRDEKVWSISKAYPGAEGTPAETHWLAVNATEVTYDPNYNTGPTPGSVSAISYVQVGDLPPYVSSAGTRIEWSRVRRSGGSIETYKDYTMGSLLNISTNSANTYSAIKFRLMKGQAQLDQQDVAILKNGLNGDKGADGRQGAAIRGPYDYYAVSSSTQCWCAGSSGANVCQECEKWIDVILKDGKYYYCATSYTGTLTSHFPSYWVEGDSFDFVATRVLLASAASINFLTNNELYLRDQNGNITGGAKGGSGTTFWAGAEEPSDAPFRVDVSGNVFAQKGVFAGYIQYPYTLVAQLEHETTGSGAANIKSIYYADGRAYLVSNEDTIGSTSYHNEAAHLVLPEPTSGWNGFTYDIIVEPSLSRMDGNQQLIIHASGETDIYCYAFAELRRATYYELTGGRYQITCMPKKIEDAWGDMVYGYRWAITLATGGINVYKNYGESSQSEEFISTLLGTSWDTPSLVNKIVTYTGSTKPTVPSTGNTMYVKL